MGKKKNLKNLFSNIQIRKMKIYLKIQKILYSWLIYYFVFICILMSVGSVILGSFDEFSTYHKQLNSVTYFTSFVFFIEYILRLYSAPAEYEDVKKSKARVKYIFSFYGLVDFVAMLPFILTYLYWNTSHIHLIILPYIFIVFKLIRYSRSFQLIGHVLKSIKTELFVAYTACGILICFSAILIYYAEREAQPEVFRNIGDGFWWATVTFTTVGYGDIYPITMIGRIMGGIISMIGIAMIAVPTGIISSAFISVMQEKREKEKENKEKENKH